jgi:hypothetical protein
VTIRLICVICVPFCFALQKVSGSEGGLTNRRIAKLTGLTENNVGIILYRAVRRLRAELEVQGVER